MQLIDVLFEHSATIGRVSCRIIAVVRQKRTFLLRQYCGHYILPKQRQIARRSCLSGFKPIKYRSMFLFKYLRYTSADSGPIGYKTRISLIALAPMMPFIFLDIQPSASAATRAVFFLAVVWGATIYAVAMRELFNSIWKKRK